LSVPAVIVSRYTDTDAAPAIASKHPNTPMFGKSIDGIERLADFIHGFVERPPFTFVAISDLHAGYIAERDANASRSFRDSLVADLKRLRQSRRIDYLLVAGDLAWRNQRDDLIEAHTTLSLMRNALQLSDAEAVHLCPGNHDVNYKEKEPWSDFEQFVRSLGADQPGVLSRYYCYNERAQELGHFNDRRSTLAVMSDPKRSVLFAALNSCQTTEENKVVAEIGDEQWDALERLASDAPPGQLRIALFHHPLMAAPGGDFQDERALLDQGRALHRLAKLKFRMVIHGHAHFSAIYEHRVSVFNRAGTDEAVPKLVVLACPTAGAEPHQGAPFRQYYVVRVGRFDKSSSLRGLSVETRVFNPVDVSWTDGAEMPEGRFFV
jgi:3',5'-cyclic AMP phosphodiesterase CpdA